MALRFRKLDRLLQQGRIPPPLTHSSTTYMIYMFYTVKNFKWRCERVGEWRSW